MELSDTIDIEAARLTQKREKEFHVAFATLQT